MPTVLREGRLVDRIGNHVERVSDDAIAVLGRVLIAHGGDRRRVSSAMHELDCRRASCCGQCQTRVSKVVEVQVRATDDCARTLPSDLEHVPREWRTSDANEHKGFRLGVRVSSEVVTDSRDQKLGNRDCASPGNRFWLLD